MVSQNEGNCYNFFVVVRKKVLKVEWDGSVDKVLVKKPTYLRLDPIFQVNFIFQWVAVAYVYKHTSKQLEVLNDARCFKYPVVKTSVEILSVSQI